MKRFLLLCLILYPLSGLAQSTSVGGVVSDPSGAVIAKASVEFRDQATGVRRQVTTNRDGFYQIDGIVPAEYDATVQATGFKTLTRENIVFHVGDKVQIDFSMQIGTSSEHVDVDGSGQQLNTTDASVSTVIDRKFVENMPLNGRSFQDLISMTPGVVTASPQSATGIGTYGDFSVNGQRTESNYYTVDGVSANNSAGTGAGTGPATGGSLAASTALGTTQSLISVDALQEFRVESSTYSAEYGRSPGGQFSLATRSGTNDFHGSIFDYLRNDFFDANDWFNDHYGKPIPALRQNDFGGTLGGPLSIPRIYNGKDRTFFFLSYEGLRLDQPIAATIQYVPDLFMRQQATSAMQPILNAFPVPNGLDYGTNTSPNLAQFIAPFSLPSSIDATSIRINHTFNRKLLFFFRYGYTPSSSNSRPAFALQTNTSNVRTFTLGTTSQISENINNEFRLGYTRSNAQQKGVLDTFGGATPVNLSAALGAGSFNSVSPIVYIYIPGIGSSTLNPALSATENRQYNLTDTLSLVVGKHSIRVGGDYRHFKSPLLPPSLEPYPVFESPTSILTGVPDAALVLANKSATPVFNEVALFAQDDWRVRPNLSISLGLRWEVDPPPTGADGDDAFTLSGSVSNPASLSVAPQGTPLWRTPWYNFAPRLGAAWTVNSKKSWETVVRGGGGVFFDNPNEVSGLGFNELGFGAVGFAAGASIPYTTAELTVPISTAAPYTSSVPIAFPEHLQLPYTLEWNVSIQQAVGSHQTATASYVGSNGRRLIGAEELSITQFNPNFGTVEIFPGGITSSYQAMQLQFQRSIAKGFQLLTAYTWSHSLDFGSNANQLPLTRGNSDFDVRNNFQGGASWDIPMPAKSKLTRAILGNWGIDGRLNIRTGFPVTLAGNQITDPSTGSTYAGNLSLVSGQPIYVYGRQYPGGRAINSGAFSLPSAGSLGNAPRNFVRGFGADQLNVSARRDFQLHGRAKVQFRMDAFNILNHPNFGYIDPNFTDATFGQATMMLNSSLGTVASQYQQGGARSLQFAMKVQF